MSQHRRASHPTPHRALLARLLAVLAIALCGASWTCHFSTGTPPPCERPEDCRLHEASALSGVHFGFHDENGPGDADAELAADEGNAITNHGVSWRSFEPSRGLYTASMDASCTFAEERDLFQIGFHFAWNQALLDDFPAWVGGVTDPDELRSVLRGRVRAIFERCPGLDRIDVVNEPLATLSGATLHPNHFHQVLGPDYVEELLRIVREEAPPEVELFINENFIEYFPDRAAAYVELVRDLVESGAPLDAVGLQTHLLLVTPPFAAEPDWALMRRTMDDLAALGVKVFVSELDVPVPPGTPDRREVQANRYARVVETCLAVPACDAIVVWGIDDGHTWLDSFDLLSGPEPDPLLFDDALRRKPAYEAVRESLLRGRGGDHPIAGDRLEVRRRGDGSAISIRSTDPRVVSPTPRSKNDPARGGLDTVTIELIPHTAAPTTSTLEGGDRWTVHRGIATRFGDTTWLTLREGDGLELDLRATSMAMKDTTGGMSVRLTLGSLRLCLAFDASTLTESSGDLVVYETAARPADCDTLAP